MTRSFPCSLCSCRCFSRCVFSLLTITALRLLLPLFLGKRYYSFQVYPDWVILFVGKGELSPALKTLYALCCEHFSCEGGLILVDGEPASFTYPKEELKFCKTTAVCNIQEACRSLELQLNQFIGERGLGSLTSRSVQRRRRARLRISFYS